MAHDWGTGIAGLLLLGVRLTGGCAFSLIRLLSHSVGAFMGRYGPLWTLRSEALPPSVAGVGIGLINGARNLGGAVSPWFFGVLRGHFGDFSVALGAAGVSLIVSTSLAIAIRSDRRRPGCSDADAARLARLRTLGGAG